MKSGIKLWFIVLITALLPAIAQAQKLFVSCADGSIYKFDTNGVMSTFASGLAAPQGVAVDSAGYVFVATYSGIYKFTPNGTPGLFGPVSAMPRGLAFDSAGNLFEGDATDVSHGPGYGCIYKFTPEGVRSTFVADLPWPYCFNAGGLAFDSAGNLFLADWSFYNVLKFAPDGTPSQLAAGWSATGLAVDSSGNLFGADQYNGIIYKFETNGTQSTFASGLNDPLGMGQGLGLAFDDAGNLFVADSGSGNIYRFTPAGTRSTFASGLNSPNFLAFEGAFVVPLPPPPPLNIAPAGSQTALFWLGSATNCVLETATDLSSTNWTAVTNGVPYNCIVVTDALPTQFFRLRQY